MINKVENRRTKNYDVISLKQIFVSSKKIDTHCRNDVANMIDAIERFIQRDEKRTIKNYYFDAENQKIYQLLEIFFLKIM